jgi:hypothetical protein
MSRWLWRVVATGWLLVLLVLLAGCQRLQGATSGSPPSPCTAQDVRHVVERFIGAFNLGDIVQLDQLVSSQQFVWYSTDAPGQRLNAEADDRGNLMAYFAARHGQHERLALISLDVTYTNPRQGGFWFRVTRSADDGLPPTRYTGKGEVQCATMPISLTVWSMAPSPWSPIELLPEAAALVLVGAAIGATVWWRRRTSRRAASAA